MPKLNGWWWRNELSPYPLLRRGARLLPLPITDEASFVTEVFSYRGARPSLYPPATPPPANRENDAFLCGLV